MDEHWTEKYITKLRETGLPGRARSHARVSKALVDRRYQQDVEFQEAVSDAMDKWADTLEEEAFRRAVTGTEKGVYYQGELVANEKQYSDTLLGKMLEAHRKERYGKEVKVTGNGPGGALTVNVRRFDSDGNELPSYASSAPQEAADAALSAAAAGLSADDLA